MKHPLSTKLRTPGATVTLDPGPGLSVGVSIFLLREKYECTSMETQVRDHNTFKVP